jgi:sirohydrochlorin cobaltochelatase
MTKETKSRRCCGGAAFGVIHSSKRECFIGVRDDPDARGRTLTAAPCVIKLEERRQAMSSAIILFAHGAREPEWARPFEQVRDRLRSEGLRVELAYLELMTPTLEEAARKLAEEGFRAASVVPLFLAQGGHLKRDLPERVAGLRRRYPGTEFRVTAALGEAPEIVAAITDWVQRAAR